MNKIIPATLEHIPALSEIATQSFWSSHGHSASKKDITTFIEANFTQAALRNELSNPDFKYFVLFHENQLAGYTKLVFDKPYENVVETSISKLEKIYLIDSFYGKNLGQELLNFTIAYAKENKQKGMWLAVWVENQRAFKFYQKNGFEIVGSYDYPISPTHSNPNHIMYLAF